MMTNYSFEYSSDRADNELSPELSELESCDTQNCLFSKVDNADPAICGWDASLLTMLLHYCWLSLTYLTSKKLRDSNALSTKGISCKSTGEISALLWGLEEPRFWKSAGSTASSIVKNYTSEVVGVGTWGWHHLWCCLVVLASPACVTRTTILGPAAAALATAVGKLGIAGKLLSHPCFFMVLASDSKSSVVSWISWDWVTVCILAAREFEQVTTIRASWLLGKEAGSVPTNIHIVGKLANIK